MGIFKNVGHTLCGGLNERTQDEGHVVTRVETVPERARGKSGHTGTETRLLALGSNTQVDVVAQPVVGVLVPASEVGVRVLGSLQTPRINILQAVPEDLTGLAIKAIVPHAGQNTGALSERPDTIILQTGGESNHVDDPDATGESIVHERVRKDKVCGVPGAQLQEQEDPAQTDDSFLESRGSATRDLALLLGGGDLGRIRAWRDFK